MTKYFNIVVINGIDYTNVVEANNYKEALKIQKERKSKSNHTFKGKLTK